MKRKKQNRINADREKTKGEKMWRTNEEKELQRNKRTKGKRLRRRSFNERSRRGFSGTVRKRGPQ
ncbi:hypothetical protein L484_005279 [Morus notabilis]|uniref:Uncharacterized protein n=1 Tax=Morus notabilis TaxID=981085 RepID=W9QLD0_9ROSA|nr:hypothetical protein L484_005279 [Morus notabilis]